MSNDLIKALHSYEVSVLKVLAKKDDLKGLVKKTGLEEINIKRGIQWLENKGLVKSEVVTERYVDLGSNGIEYKKNSLPEVRFIKALSDSFKSLADVKKETGLSDDEAKVSIGLLKRRQAIDISNDNGLVVKINDEGKKFLKEDFDEQLFLKKSFPLKIGSLEKKEEQVFKDLMKRKDILFSFDVKDVLVSITSKGDKLKKEVEGFDFSKLTDKLTSDMLKSGSWKGKEFRHFDVLSKVPRVVGGRKHPLSAIIDMVRDIFVEMGFKEMKGPLVETSFWCLDSMWIPQDHPAREVQDTFYLPYKGKLPSKKVIDEVKKVHEDGGSTGSKGYGYKWDPEMAKQLLMRTHTTATTYRYLHEKNISDEDSVKYFYIGRVFRNESIDATHLPEFHQVEGFVMQEGLTLKHLMGFIKSFYAKLGLHEIKFKVTYNPYTESSLEAMYFDKTTNSWIELINSGIFRPESLAPYGIDKPIIAWGLGLERLAMILYKKDNLKEILGATCDIDWLKTYELKMREE
ncbi:MAG: phenylalanine--tRNA ligase subunit alpha [Candidatus Woesearchaeota archaeon]